MAVPLMEATPTLPPEQPSAEAQMVPEQATEPDAAQADPPVVAWGNSDPAVPPGMGGMGGGGGQGGTGGSLLGPPEAAQNSLEMGKGGAGGNGYSVPGQNIVIPQASVNAEDSAADVQSDAAPAQANPQISGPGPILGVPAAEESGQIVDRKAILGQPSAKASEPGQQTGQESERAGEDGSQPARPPMILGLPVILALQILLALIAIATGAAAFLMRRRAR